MTTPSFAALGEARFISLTTFRKTGVPVSTPVWVAADGDALIVLTPTDTGKVKRVRNNPRVEMRPSGRMGAVADDAPTVEGTAEILDDESGRLTALLKKKYGVEFHVTMAIERIVARRHKPRLILRITPVD